MTNKNPIAIEKRHYAIRKLTIGAASVLIGLTFANGCSQLVKADSVRPVQTEQAKAPSSNQSTAKEPAGTLIVKTVEHAQTSGNAQSVSPATDKDALSKKVADEKSESLKKAASEQADSFNAQKVSSDTQKSALPKGEVYEDKKDQKKQSKEKIKSALPVKKEESTFQPQKNAKPISKQALKAEKFRALPTRVSNADEFEQAVVRAPTDDSQTDIELIHDIDLGTDRVILQAGQNIVITNDDQQRKLMIGNQLRIANGAKLAISAHQKNGIVIAPPQGRCNPENDRSLSDYTGWESYWSPLDVLGANSQLTLHNVQVTGFHFISTRDHGLTGQAESDYQNSIGDNLNQDNDVVGIITVTGGANLNLEDSQIIKNEIYDYEGTVAGWSCASAAALAIRNHASCTMNAGSEISDNHITPDALIHNNPGYNCGGVLLNGGTFVVNGGKISNNSGGAGGIFAFNNSIFGGQTNLQLHGATVANNQGYYGGGMFIYGAATGHIAVTIDHDSQIVGNAAGDRNATYSTYMEGQTMPFMGGGISVSDGLGYGQENYHIVHLLINGATIADNSAIDAGGGLYIDTNGVEIKRATIANNQCKYGRGGGLYVSVAPYKIKLSRAVIYDNQAIATRDPRTGLPYVFSTGSDSAEIAGSGGGIWLCPTGESDIRITNGMAVFDNQAQTGGDDLWNEHKNPGVPAKISDRVLGGGDANWTHDRDLEDYLGHKKFIGPEIGNNVGLKSHLTKDAIALALALANVKIYGNIGAWGGGVGSNGGVVTSFQGEPDQRSRDITITKQWDDNNDPNRPASVTIKVMAKDPTDPSKQYEVTHFELTAADHWTYELKNLPTDIDYTFTEVAIDQNHDGQPDYSESQGTLTPVHPAGAATDVDYYTLILTNKRLKTAEIKIVKHWANADDPDRPSSIKFDIYDAETGEKVSTLILSARDADASGDWVGTVKGLNDSKTYRVEEEKIDQNHDGESDYQVTAGKLTKIVSADANIDLWEIDFTNTLNNNPGPNPGPSVTRTIRIIKHWDDGNAQRPAVIKFDLYKLVNGQRQYLQTITLTSADADADGDWVGEISDLPDGDQYELAEEMIDENHDGISDYRVEEGQLQQLASGDPLVDLWQIVFVNSKEPTPTPTPVPIPEPNPTPVPVPTPTPEPNPTPGKKPGKNPTWRVIEVSKHRASGPKVPKKHENKERASEQLPKTGEKKLGLIASLLSLLAGVSLLLGTAGDRRHQH